MHTSIVSTSRELLEIGHHLPITSGVSQVSGTVPLTCSLMKPMASANFVTQPAEKVVSDLAQITVDAMILNVLHAVASSEAPTVSPVDSLPASHEEATNLATARLASHVTQLTELKTSTRVA